MIAYLSGQLQCKNLKTAVISVGGVGYRVSMPLSDLSLLKDLGQLISVHVHTHVREDALELYAFLEEQSLEVFERLISVSGVGPKMALSILSALQPSELSMALASGDYVRLTRVPGIGPKMAQRLVLELKDKIQPSLQTWGLDRAFADLRSAILNLGYKAHQADKAMKSVEHLKNENRPLSDLLKTALREI